jgi:hypothetical protein
MVDLYLELQKVEMIFKQNKDGSCNIEFSNEEIEILNKNKKLHLPVESLKHFGNHLVRIISEWHINFNEEIKNKTTYKETEIESK